MRTRIASGIPELVANVEANALTYDQAPIIVEAHNVPSPALHRPRRVGQTHQYSSTAPGVLYTPARVRAGVYKTQLLARPSLREGEYWIARP